MKKLAKKAAQFVYIMFFAALVAVVVISVLKLTTGYNLPANRWWDVLAISLFFAMGVMTIKELVAAKQDFLASVSILTAYAAWLFGVIFFTNIAYYDYHRSDLVCLVYALIGVIAIIVTFVVYRKQVFGVLFRDENLPAKYILGVSGVIFGMTWLAFLFNYSITKGIAPAFYSPAAEEMFIIPIVLFSVSLMVVLILTACIMLPYEVGKVVVKGIVIFHKFAWKKEK